MVTKVNIDVYESLNDNNDILLYTQYCKLYKWKNYVKYVTKIKLRFIS